MNYIFLYTSHIMFKFYTLNKRKLTASDICIYMISDYTQLSKLIIFYILVKDQINAIQPIFYRKHPVEYLKTSSEFFPYVMMYHKSPVCPCK